MKPFFISCSFSLLLLACAENEPEEIVTVRSVDKIGHRIDSMPDTAITPAPLPTNDSLDITGTAYYRVSYCGGAAPSQEMMEEMRQPRIFTGQLYFVKEGIKTKVATDASGHFSCRLVRGEYKVYLAKNRRGPESYWYDEAHDGKWWAQQVFAQFSIKNNKTVKFILDFACSPTDRKRP